MKKFLWTILLAFILILPTFSAENITTVQLNKQGWEYLKEQNYEKAYNTFNSIYDKAKTHQDYEFVVYGYLELIKNKQLPDEIRFNLCRELLSFESEIKDDTFDSIFDAVFFKSANLIANADEKKWNIDKQELLNKFKNEIYSKYNKQNAPPWERLRFALCEYAIGNKELALIQIEKEMNNINNHTTPYIKSESNKLVQYVTELCE